MRRSKNRKGRVYQRRMGQQTYDQKKQIARRKRKGREDWEWMHWTCTRRKGI